MNDITEKVSDQMEKASDKLKDQMDQVNESLNQLICASKGLLLKLSETGNKQFNELVKAGEGKTFSGEIKNSLPKLSDAKQSIKQIRCATVGLISKAKQSGSRYFNELVKQGETQAALSTKSIVNTTGRTSNTNKTKAA